MSVLTFLSQLETYGIILELPDSGRQLKIKAPPGILKPDLMTKIKERKEEIITFLEGVRRQAKYAGIRPADRKPYYTLSPIQLRLYALQQLDKNATAYNMPSAWLLQGLNDPSKLENTIKNLVQRHESLRTSFEMRGDTPVQVIHESIQLDILWVDVLGDLSGMLKDFIQPFDLSAAPLIRVGLFKLEKDKYVFIVDLHHIVSDGVSHGILVKDFISLYAGQKLKPLKLQYKDFAQWYQRQWEAGEFKGQEEFWLQEFTGEIPVLSLPTDYPRPAIQNFEGDALDFNLDPQLTKKLAETAVLQNVTLFMILLSVLNLFLAKLCGQEDIVVGTPTAGRGHPDLEPIIGMFVNTLALRNYPVMSMTMDNFLEKVRINTLAAFDNQDYPFDELVEQIGIKRDISRNPLFDTMFGLLNQKGAFSGGETSVIHGLKVTPHTYENKSSKFDLTLHAMEQGEALNLSFKYCTRLFKRETILRFTGYFKTAVESVVDNIHREIGQLEILPQHEKQQVLFLFNSSSSEFPADKTIRQLFEARVEKHPQKTAVMSGDDVLSYTSLNKKANRLAQVLVQKGAGPGKLVALAVPSGAELPLGILGILKTGAGFLPIDPETPAGRINYMLNDSNCKLLLVKGEPGPGITFPGEIINLANSRAFASEPKNVENENDPSSVVYAIFTSGTTGKPKGVLLKNENLVNYVNWFTLTASLTETDRAILISSFAFDLGYTAIFPSLLIGGQLHLLSRETYVMADLLLNYIRDNNISYIKLTPSLLSVLVNSSSFSAEVFRSLRLIVVGGEAIILKDIKRVHSLCPKIEFMNHYGPTEATIGCIAQYIDLNRIEDYEKTPTIGNPIANTQVFILNRNLHPQPIGIPGELWVSGAGLALGYLNRPELTAQRFVDFNNSRWSHRSYKTGDLAKWTPEGQVEFLGRIDNQVKIRGYRIELDEIENLLLEHETIKEAALVVRKDGGTPYICAYIVSDGESSVRNIRHHLSDNLPEYMIPHYILILEKLPLTANGKLNRHALPDPGDTGDIPNDQSFEAPGNVIETTLAAIWQKVLGQEKLGVMDNFFMKGGDSIKAIQIAARIRKEGYKIEMRDIFLNPTIRELAPLVTRLERIPDQSTITGTVPLTPIQSEFFMHNETHRHHYNMSVMIQSPKGFDAESVRFVFSKIMEHHDALRMVFKEENGQIIQFNEGTELPLLLKEFDFRARQDALQLMAEAAGTIQTSFDLSTGPLLKLGLFHLDSGGYLLIAVHHLVMDAVSWRIMFEDIDTLFRQYSNGEVSELPGKSDSFKVWSEKLSEYANSDSFLIEKNYWSALTAQEVPVVPEDFPGGDNCVKDTRTSIIQLSENETALLMEKSNDFLGTEINDILLAALGLAVNDSFSYDKFAVLLESHGREEIVEEIDISRTVGWFSSKYPVVFDLSYRQELTRYIKEVKETLRRAPNRGLGFWLLKHLTSPDLRKGIQLDISPQITFNYLGQFDQDVNQNAFQVLDRGFGESISPERERNCQWEISGMAVGGRLTMSVAYSIHQYMPRTMQGLMDNYKSALQRIISHCATQEERELTPSDLTYKELSITEIEDIQNLIDGIETQETA